MNRHPLIAPLVLTALLLAAWEIAVRLTHTPAYLLPAPSAVAVALANGWPVLLASAAATLGMALWALLVASIAVSLLGLAAGVSPTFEKAVRPLAVAVQSTPIVALAPLAAIWAGLDHPERAVAGLAAVAAFFPLFSGLVTGLRSADPDLERLFDLYGASRWRRFTSLRLPSALPFILEGARVAAGFALVGAVVAEFVAGSGASQGLAWRILEAGNRLQTARMFAALLILGVMGGVLHGVFLMAERRLIARWRGRPLGGD
ncbi:MAG: ABC transporter permease [Caulobacteraceae bacterium]